MCGLKLNKLLDADGNLGDVIFAPNLKILMLLIGSTNAGGGSNFFEISNSVWQNP